MFTDILWRFLILETLVLGVLCTYICPMKHPQEVFCRSDFDGRGQSDGRHGHGGQYYMDVDDNIVAIDDIRFLSNVIYLGSRFDFNLTNYRILVLQAAISVAGYKSLIYGKNINGTLHSGVCTFNLPWRLVDHIYHKHLKDNYKLGCVCVDQIGSFPYYSCRSIYSYMISVNGSCQWQINKAYRNCDRG